MVSADDHHEERNGVYIVYADGYGFGIIEEKSALAHASVVYFEVEGEDSYEVVVLPNEDFTIISYLEDEL